LAPSSTFIHSYVHTQGMYACTLLTLSLQVASCLTTSSNEPVNLHPHSHAWGVSSRGVRDSSSRFSSALLAADSASNRALRSFSTFLRSSSSAASLMTAHRLAWGGASQASASISSLARALPVFIELPGSLSTFLANRLDPLLPQNVSVGLEL